MASLTTRGQQTPGLCGVIVPLRESEDKGPADLWVCVQNVVPWHLNSDSSERSTPYI